MSKSEKFERWSNVFIWISIALVIYGASTNFFIPRESVGELNIFKVNAVELVPQAFTLTDKPAGVLHGAQNGIALSGELIWQGLKMAWNDYKDFPDNILMKVVWAVAGIVIELVKWFFIMLAAFFVMIYKLSQVGGVEYKIVLIISALIPPGLYCIGATLLDRADSFE